MATSARLGYNGTLHEPSSRWQLLGNGRRVFNPELMRFHSPDSLSPFSRGGLNAYAYCTGNPSNCSDPSGQFPMLLMGLLGATTSVAPSATPVASEPRSDEGGVGGWLIAGIIAAVAVLGVAGVAAARTMGPSFGSRVKGSPPRSGLHAGPKRLEAGRNPVRYRISERHINYDVGGQAQVDIRNLKQPVIDRILSIRDHAPGGLVPDLRRLPQGDRYRNFQGKLPPKPKLRSYYWEYRIKSLQRKRYHRTRVVSGGGPEEGIENIYVTDDHYGRFVRVQGWREYAPG